MTTRDRAARRWWHAAVMLLVAAGSGPAAEAQTVLYQLQGVDKEHPLAEGGPSGWWSEGLSVRVRWSTLEPLPGLYDFRYLDAQQARAAESGRYWRLRVMAGVNTPAHAYDTYLDDESRGELLRIPLPWDAKYKAAHTELQLALALRYGDDPNLLHVDVPGFWRSAEMHIPKALELHEQFTDERMAAAFTDRIDDIQTLFPDQTAVLNHSPEGDWGEAVRIYAQLQGVGGQMNSLKASTATDWEGYTLVRDWQGPGGWQTVSPSGNAQRFGGTLEEALTKGWQGPRDWLELYRQDLPAARAWLATQGEQPESGQTPTGHGTP